MKNDKVPSLKKRLLGNSPWIKIAKFILFNSVIFGFVAPYSPSIIGLIFLGLGIFTIYSIVLGLIVWIISLIIIKKNDQYAKRAKENAAVAIILMNGIAGLILIAMIICFVFIWVIF